MSDVRCWMDIADTSLPRPSLKDRVHVGCGGTLSQGSGEKEGPPQAGHLLQDRWVASRGTVLCAFALLELQLLFWVPRWGCLIIPEQMSSAGWGRGGRPAWAAEERLGHGAPVGNEAQELVVEVELMQGW